MNEIIIDKNLSRILKVKMCVNELNNIDEIEDIDIQNINLMGKELNINLTEIIKLKNLKSLSLKFFDITDEVIDTINQLEFIDKIEFSMCIFKTKKALKETIKSVTIYNCKSFDIELLKDNTVLEELKLIHSGLIDIFNLNIFENLKYLKIADCNIISVPKISLLEKLEYLYLNNVELQYDINITTMKNLKLISLNGSKVQDKGKYVKMLYEQNKELLIEFEEDSLPIE